jgi:Type VI secretion system (T6SS), amidase effector protein 4
VALPPLNSMWDLYLTGAPAEVAVMVGGTIGDNIKTNHFETCCIRLSRSLNYAGSPVHGFAEMANPYMSGPHQKVRARQGADKKWYIYSCYDMRVYLEKRFGRAKRFGSFATSDLSKVGGVIMFAFRHVDLWNGTQVRYNTNFTDGTKTVNEILVWETPQEDQGWQGACA